MRFGMHISSISISHQKTLLARPPSQEYTHNMEHLSLHTLFKGANDMTMAPDHDAIHIEKAHRFLNWPIARLLQIVHNDTPNYEECRAYLIRICDRRIEPVMTGLAPVTSNARQDLIDLLQFKEWYASDDVPKIDPIGTILKRYPIQALRDTINSHPPPARYQRRRLTTYGPCVF